MSGTKRLILEEITENTKLRGPALVKALKEQNTMDGTVRRVKSTLSIGKKSMI